MQYSIVFLSVLAATATLALPTRRQDAEVEFVVSLVNTAAELGSGTTFEGEQRQEKAPTAISGPFRTVELKLGDNVQNKDLRCQLINEQGEPIVVTRGENVDVTFGDGDGGFWEFRDDEFIVDNIICDPAFVKGEAPPPSPAPPAEDAPGHDNDQDDLSIRVTLTGDDEDSETEFKKGGFRREKKKPRGSRGPYKSVNLELGTDVEKQDLRCQLIDQNNKPITVQRGQNIDTTFADGGNGPWSFLDPKESKVKRIICDPKFVKAST